MRKGHTMFISPISETVLENSVWYPYNFVLFYVQVIIKYV